MDRITALFGVDAKLGQITSTVVNAPKKTDRDGGKGNRPMERKLPTDSVTVPEVKELKRGEILFKEGDASGCAYYVEAGEVEIVVSSKYGYSIVNSVTAGEVVGEMGVIDRKPRNASAIARSNTIVRVIECDALNEILAGADPATRALLTLMMKRLRATTEKFALGNA